MKSRKALKRSSPTRKASIRQALKHGTRTFESLEDRRLMTVQPWSDGMYYPPIGASTAWLPTNLSVQQYKAISQVQYANAGGSALGGEGSQGATTIREAEPNSRIATAQFFPLGNGDTEYNQVAVIGTLP